MFNLNRHIHGFTLAEVLITLGVIGVVAVMTIPTLIQKTQEQELVNRWFKTYAMLQNAIKLAEEDCGDSSTWTWKTYMNYTNLDTEGSAYACMKPYLKIVSDCPTGGAACFLTKNDDYSFLDNKPASYCNYYGPAVKLISGETICFSGGAPHFIVDLNGTSKPNKLGVDVHYFSFIDLPTRTFLPGFNWGWRDSADNAEYCNAESGWWHDGASCGFWIQRHKNMKYLHMTKEQVKKEWKTYK